MNFHLYLTAIGRRAKGNIPMLPEELSEERLSLLVTVEEHSITTIGQGNSKKEAKLNAAIACLSKWVENCDSEMSLLSN